jgi:protein-S-isoprenylcysteine O-methyltransferase Ste14
VNQPTKGCWAQSQTDAENDNPGVVAHPPLIYLGSILAGSALHAAYPVSVVPHAVAAPLGALSVAAAIALIGLSVRELCRAGTGVRTSDPTTVLVKSGPYRFSRNPIYLAFTLFHFGVGVWLNSAWVLGMLLPAVAMISYGVIAREEQYLARKFGEEYLHYRASVRRWI